MSAIALSYRSQHPTDALATPSPRIAHAPAQPAPDPAPIHRRWSKWTDPAPRAMLAPLVAAILAVAAGAAARTDLLPAALAAGVYALAAAGFGRAARRALPAADPALTLALGWALLLSLSHLLGILGLLRTPAATLGIILLGLAGWMTSAVASGVTRRSAAEPASESPPAAEWLWLADQPARVLLLLAALLPAGWLWSSEFGGFDALSYHLQLPKEWLASGVIRPSTNNVYSFLPGYVEAAAAHLMALLALTPAPLRPASMPAETFATLHAGGVAYQLLHACMALAAARVLAAAARALCPERPGIAPALAPLALLTTPWIIVVASLAYNEMGVLLLFAAAVLAAASTALHPILRGALVGALVGVACGCKPTALLFAGIPAGLIMLRAAPARAWPTLFLTAAAAGLLTLAPWLVRNHLAASNPVFPAAASLFGSGHWAPEQLARFTAAHTFDGTWIDRLRLLVLPDPHDPAGARHRGLLHPQWALLFPAALAAIAALVAARTTRRVGITLGACLMLQLACWLAATHLQSRFLLPLAVPACLAIAIAAARAPARAALALGVLLALAQTGVALATFLAERARSPLAAMPAGPTIFHGIELRAAIDAAPPAEARQIMDSLAPEPWINLSLPPDTTRVYLLGDSTPFYLAVPTLHHTTWDTSPLGDAIRAAPADPAAWIRALRERGVTHTLINFAELERLSRSGRAGSSWYDPAVTPELVARFAETLAPPIAAWPDAGRFLFRLPDAPEHSR